MKRITVIRERGFYGKLRALKLMVDGQPVGDIKDGAEVEIELPNGAQKIWGKMDWGKTPSLQISDISDGRTVVFKARFTINPLRQLGIMKLPFRVSVR